MPKSTSRDIPTKRIRVPARLSVSSPGPKIKKSQLDRDELRYELRFPDDFRRFLLKVNGGCPDPKLFRWQHPTEGEQESQVYGLLGINIKELGPGAVENRDLDCVSLTMRSRAYLPDSVLAIGHVDRDDLLLLYTLGPRSGQVWLKDGDAVPIFEDEPIDPDDAIYFVSDDFDTFLRSLYHPVGNHDPATFALDSPKVRGKQLGVILKSLGCKVHRHAGVRSSTPHPPSWNWPKYRRCRSDDPAFLSMELNKTYGYTPKFDERPGGHKMLLVNVTETQRRACLRELAAALGDAAIILDEGWRRG